MRCFALLVLLVLLTGGAAADTGGVVDRIVEAYGGAAAVQRLRSVRTVATVASSMQGPGQVRRDLSAPDRLRVEIAYPRSTEVRVLNGADGWRGSDHALQKVQGLPRLAMVYQLLRSGAPWALVEYQKHLADRGTKTREGAEYRVLGLALPGGVDLSYWIDAGHRVVWIDGALEAGGARTGFVTRYGDFRQVEGVLFPFSERSYASGQFTGETRVLSVAFSPGDLGPFDPRGLRP